MADEDQAACTGPALDQGIGSQGSGKKNHFDGPVIFERQVLQAVLNPFGQVLRGSQGLGFSDDSIAF
jgi:hypothetical protein